MHKFAYPVEPTDGSNASTEELVVATTRLETMLGDAAIVVHPDDARYAALVGRHAIHPFDGRRIPIISDPILVDPTLGTGAVKITPAHDLNDFECASRHKLPVINIFTDDGCMNNAVAADFRGADRHDARRRVLLRLQEKNLYRGASDHPMTLSVCSRSGDLLEPMLRPQWYVRSAPLAARAFAAANPTPSQEQAAEPTTTTNATTSTAGDQAELTFTPSFYLDEWNRWTGNPQDWCVSRQLWWGHRIPAFRVQLSDAGLSVTDLVEQKALETLGQNNTFTSSADASSERVACWSASEQALWIVARSEQAARVQVEQFFAEHSKSIIPAFRLEQDPDVLDTWFSSGLYPLSAHNWPEPNWNQHGVYPLTALETGADILFFWVARMVMLCSFLEPTYGMPFSRVLLHPMVRDSRGRKMSKSLGNVIDPLHVLFGVTNKQLVAELEASTNLAAAEIKRASADIQKDFPKGIPACGPDALRLSLLSYMDQNVSFINFDVTRAVYAKNFLNKLLNATAYTLTKGATPEQLGLTACAAAESSQQLPFGLGAQVGHPEQLSSLDLWALGRLREAIASCQDGFGKFHLARVTSSIVRFGWHELCDVYVEGSKAVLNNPAAPPAARQAVSAVLRVCLDAVLRLGHPILPFATEELWHHLLPVSSAHQHSIMVAAYPTIGAFDAWLDANRIQLSPAVNKEIELVQEVVKVLRQVRQQHDVRFSMLMDVRVQHDDPSELASIEKSFALVALLARASTVTSAPNGTEVKEPWVSSAVNPTCSVQVSFRPKVAPKDSQ